MFFLSILFQGEKGETGFLEITAPSTVSDSPVSAKSYNI